MFIEAVRVQEFENWFPFSLPISSSFVTSVESWGWTTWTSSKVPALWLHTAFAEKAFSNSGWLQMQNSLAAKAAVFINLSS